MEEEKSSSRKISKDKQDLSEDWRKFFDKLYDYKSGLYWENLTIKCSKDNKTVLKQISGGCKFGSTLAIMGSSGAGKTTLMNFISMKSNTKGLKLETGNARFYIDEIDLTSKFLKLSGYVTQDDILVDVMTPKELLLFASKLKLLNKSSDEIIELVDILIEKMGLEKCQNSLVGTVEAKCLSGGERKRTAIAYELITNPKVLFLDEPTSGLDMYTAQKIMTELSNDAKKNNRAIIFTIHQPNTEMFNRFDNLLLLAGGKSMYFGPCNISVQYFANLGLLCPSNCNPSEFFVSFLSKQATFKEATKLLNRTSLGRSIGHNESDLNFLEETTNEEKENYNKLLMMLADSFIEVNSNFNIVNRESNLKLENKKSGNIQSSRASDLTATNDKIQPESQINPFFIFFWEIFLLFKRNMLVLKRDKSAFIWRFLVNVLNSLLVILMYYKLPLEGPSVITDRNGCLYYIANSCIQTNFQGNLTILIKEKQVLYKEQDNKMYSVLNYFLAKLMIEIPYQLISAIVSYLIIYFACGLNSNDYSNHLIFMLSMFVFSLSAFGMSVFLAVFIDNQEILPTLSPFIIFAQTLCSGYFVKQSAIPDVLLPIFYTSIFRYAYQILSYNEYSTLQYNCTDPVQCDNPLDFPESMEASIMALVLLTCALLILSILGLYVVVSYRRRRSKY